MQQIKIISNPYSKKITYKRFSELKSEWVDININGKLLSTRLTNGFFPFVVKEIVDEIINEYTDNKNVINLVFEGTDDEYRELVAVCSDEYYTDKVSVSKSEVYLENARDVLPDIISIFKNMGELISSNVGEDEKIKKTIKRFSEASNDIIPICVIGNYSSGKSTFINALIGNEILPSGDEPITAKIFKIQNSAHRDRAVISFEVLQEPVRIKFDGLSYSIETESDNKLIEIIKSELDKLNSQNITILVNKALELINDYENKTKEVCISDILQVLVPFSSAIIGHHNSNFVIFDTPGSNTVSNFKHLEVLKSAMEDMSNGLPIYVSEYDSLDSMDNEKLYRDIEGMVEFDDRFTMIIINKADLNSFPKEGFSEEQIERILNESVPKNLYSEGIYFVSSIMGLGSKINGDFIDDHYDEVYEEKSVKYSNPKSRHYRQLYQYNIQPSHLKEKSMELCQKQSNLVYANSGLCAVEDEINVFASKYSSYNKCQQSKKFLDDIIENTSDKIKEKKNRKEYLLKRSKKIFDNEKEKLINEIDTNNCEIKNTYEKIYSNRILSYVDSLNEKYQIDNLKDLEKNLIDKHEEINNYDDGKKKVDDSFSAIGDNLSGNFKKMFNDFSWDNFAGFTGGFFDDVKKYRSEKGSFSETEKKISSSVANEVIGTINEMYNDSILNIQNEIEEYSKLYLENLSTDFKEELGDLVAQNSKLLTDQKKSEIAEIILNYSSINFDTTKTKRFKKDDFADKLFAFFSGKEKVDIEKLQFSFNESIEEKSKDFANRIKEDHIKNIFVWMASLVDIVKKNIVEYNPSLANQLKDLKDDEKYIESLENRIVKIKEYNQEIERMIGWKNS